MRLPALTFEGSGNVTVQLVTNLEHRFYAPNFIRLIVLYDTTYPVRLNGGDLRFNVHAQHALGYRYSEDYLPMKPIHDYFIYGETLIQAEGQWRDNNYNAEFLEYLREQEKTFITEDVIKQALGEYHHSRLVELESDLKVAQMRVDKANQDYWECKANFKVNV